MDVCPSAKEEYLDDLGTGMINSAGYLAGELLDSVEVVGLSEAYRDEMDLYRYLEHVDLDISNSRALFSPQKCH